MLILIKADPFTKVFHVFFLTITKSEFYDLKRLKDKGALGRIMTSPYESNWKSPLFWNYNPHGVDFSLVTIKDDILALNRRLRS